MIKLFGWLSRTKRLEELREHIAGVNTDTSSYMDIVRTIRANVTKFKHNKGMAVIVSEVVEGYSHVAIYFFDGIPKVTWSYINHQFSTDRVGETFLVGPPLKFVLTRTPQDLLPAVLRREFAGCDIHIQSLWLLDRTAWDYELQKIAHTRDIGIRISFERSQNTANR